MEYITGRRIGELEQSNQNQEGIIKGQKSAWSSVSTLNDGKVLVSYYGIKTY